MRLIDRICAVLLSFEVDFVNFGGIIGALFVVPDLCSVLPGTFPEPVDISQFSAHVWTRPDSRI